MARVWDLAAALGPATDFRAAWFRFSEGRNDHALIDIDMAKVSSKKRVVAHLSARLKLDRKLVVNVVDELGRFARLELKRSGKIELPGIAQLSIRRAKARQGRNPATGKPIKVPARMVVKARFPSDVTRYLMAGGGPEGGEIPPDRPKRRL